MPGFAVLRALAGLVLATWHSFVTPSLAKVKEVKIDPEGQRNSDAELERVRADADARRAALEQVRTDWLLLLQHLV